MPGNFRDLNIWKEGLELVGEIYKLSRKFPVEEKYGLTDQMRRSANSAVALIAEAHGRYHYADKCRVLYQSRGECTETQSHLSVALKLGYIDKSEFDILDNKYDVLARRINSYIRVLHPD